MLPSFVGRIVQRPPAYSALKVAGKRAYQLARAGKAVELAGRDIDVYSLRIVTYDYPRLVLDVAPQYVIPAAISFVADVAQFTPKTVETTEERLKLMFRVKARIDPALLRQYMSQVKTGLPGMAYVRLDPEMAWPPELQVRMPE